MSDEPKKRRSRGWIGWAAFLLLVLYPLSVGPATVFYEIVDPNGTPFSNPMYLSIYHPLFAFSGFTNSDELLQEYLGLFVNLDST